MSDEQMSEFPDLVLGIGPPVSGNGPHLCTQFMNRVILIIGGKQFYKKQSYKKNY